MVLRRGLAAVLLGWASALAPAWATAPVAACTGVGAWASLGRADVQPTVLVMLSPRMPYALMRWPAMRDAAVGAGFHVQAVRDPRVPLPEWQDAVQAVGLPELACLPALHEPLAARLGLLHHAPSSRVLRCGRLHPWPVLGVMPDAAWVELLRHRLRQLEPAPCP